MTKGERELSNVQNLYMLQVKLLNALDQDLGDPKVRKDVRASMREFEDLLNVVDHRYMGGDDVLESFQKLPEEVLVKLKESPVAVNRVNKKK